MFINTDRKKQGKAVHINKISAWMKGLVTKAYEIANTNQSASLHRSTHEIRALAASFNINANFSIEQIMTQCRWKNHTTFTSFYMRDVSGKMDDLYALPPLLAAGSVVNRAKSK